MKELPESLKKRQELQRQQTVNKVLYAIDDLEREGYKIRVKDLIEYTGLARSTFSKDHVRQVLIEKNIAEVKEGDEKSVKTKTNKKTRIGKILSVNASHLLETTHTFEELSTTVRIVIGDINIIRGRRDLQFQFVNNRPVENKNINFHINNVCRLIFPPAKFPAFCLFIDLPAENVDVNIHPTKREVKLNDEQKLCSMIRNLTEQLLMNSGQAKQAANRPNSDK